MNVINESKKGKALQTLHFPPYNFLILTLKSLSHSTDIPHKPTTCFEPSHPALISDKNQVEKKPQPRFVSLLWEYR